MPEIARWKIRPVAVGDVCGNVQELERKIVPVYGPILIGTLAGHFPEPKENWNYELIETDKQTNNFLIREITQKKPRLDALVNNAAFQAIIRINPNKFRHISRFHAMLGMINGDLYIADLESKNGTYAGSSVEAGYPLILGNNQTILLGGKNRDSAQLKVYEAIPFASALLIGVDYKKEAETAIEKSIWQMDHLIRKLRIPYECSMLTHESATKEEITHHLQLAERLSEKSLFFFFYDAHGSKNAITTTNGKILKTELAQLLNRIKAKKVVVIDACHAEGGWQELDLSSGLYFFSSKEDEKAKWAGFAPRFAERVAELLNREEPVDMKKIEISDLITKHTPVRGGYQSIILL